MLQLKQGENAIFKWDLFQTDGPYTLPVLLSSIKSIELDIIKQDDQSIIATFCFQDIYTPQLRQGDTASQLLFELDLATSAILPIRKNLLARITFKIANVNFYSDFVQEFIVDTSLCVVQP